MSVRTVGFLGLMTALLLPLACAKQTIPSEPPVVMTLSGSMPKLFVAGSCVLAVPAGDEHRVMAIAIGSDGEPYGLPMSLDEEGWKKFTDDLAPALAFQGADPQKRLLVCMPKRHP